MRGSCLPLPVGSRFAVTPAARTCRASGARNVVAHVERVHQRIDVRDIPVDRLASGHGFSGDERRACLGDDDQAIW
jgi:hypothetical protein